MVQVERLRVTYGSVVAVDDLSFTARAGEIFGLLGPNGAGKTTCISCISGLLKPTSGRVAVAGALGVVPQEIALYDDLSAHENLSYWGGAQRMRGRALRDRVQQLLEQTGLADRAREPVARFSGGMKRRLNFACGIVHQPKVLLLDEPTVGVDPQSRVRLLDLTRDLARAGTAVLYTTHYMEEAESLCDRVAIVDHGRVLAGGTLPELRSLLNERDLVRFAGVFQPDAVRRAFAGGGIDVVQAEESVVTLSLEDASRRLPAIIAGLSGAGGEIRSTTLSQPNLESLFIKLTGKELRE
jgi:ABC-2 type transport system ATP-binding protein